jgi:hypothetical protein
LFEIGVAHAQISFGIVPATLFWQETDQWCWAASGQMMMNYVGPRNVPQCYEANQRFGRTDCCNCPTPNGCAQPGWPDFDAWGYNFKETPTALSWSQLTAEVNAKRPIWFAWGWTGGGGHALVARGYEQVNILFFQEKLVLVDNPWPWQGRCGAGNASGPFGGDSLEIHSYDDFVGGPGYNHVTWSNIYQVAHK